MRAISRDRIIKAVLSIAARSGIPGITMDTVATEAQLSKGGVQYHFASKEEMMQAIIDDAIRRFDRAALAYLDKPLQDAMLAERLEAFIRCSMTGHAGAGELAVFLYDAHTTDGNTSWSALVERWTTAPGETPNDAQRVMLLAADGLWLANASGWESTGRSDRAREIDYMVATITSAGTSPLGFEGDTGRSASRSGERANA